MKTTKKKRAELRQELGRCGRTEMLALLLDAWDQLDDADDVCGSDAILEATKGTNDGQD